MLGPREGSRYMTLYDGTLGTHMVRACKADMIYMDTIKLMLATTTVLID